MVYHVRTVAAVTDAGLEALRKALKYYRERYPKVHLVWLTSMSGELGTHVFVDDYPTLAAWEEHDAKVNADPGWTEIWKEAGPGPFWSSIRDEFYNVVKE